MAKYECSQNTSGFDDRPIRRHLSLVLALAMALITIEVAVAAAMFSSYTGPMWPGPTGSGYQFTADVTLMSTPHQNVCLSYSVNGVSQTPQDCTCTAPACIPATGIGTWDCLIPVDYINATIDWDISAYPGSSCTGTKADGFSGSFGTGPTAAGLTTISVEPSADKETGLVVLGALLLITLAATLARRGIPPIRLS